MICDDASVQPLLPQILVGNERIFPQQLLECLQGELAPIMLIWRRKTGWVTKPLMREVLRALLASLGPRAHSRRVMLLMGTAPVTYAAVSCSRLRHTGSLFSTCRPS